MPDFNEQDLQDLIDQFNAQNDGPPSPGGDNPYWVGGADENGVPNFSPQNPPPNIDGVRPFDAGDQSRNFGDLVGRNGAPAPAPVAVQEPPSPGFGGNRDFNPDQPYATPDFRNDSGGRRMADSIGMVRDLFGVGDGGNGQVGTAGGAYRDDWERRNSGRNFDDTVIDYRGSGIDLGPMERGGLPVERVNSITGKQLGSKEISDYGDLRNIQGSVTMRDKAGEPIMDAQGRTQRYDLPGWNGQQRFSSGMTPTTLENGQGVMYDRFNNLTYGMKDGQPDRLLPGGLGYQGGASGGAYGLIPTTMQGRPVFYDQQGNRTFERIGDKVGRNIASAPQGGATGGRGPGGPPPPPPSDGEKVIFSGEGYTYMVNPADNSIRSYNGNGEGKVISYDQFLQSKAAIEQRMGQRAEGTQRGNDSAILAGMGAGNRFEGNGGKPVAPQTPATAVPQTTGQYQVTPNPDGTFTVRDTYGGTVMNGVTRQALVQMGLVA